MPLLPSLSEDGWVDNSLLTGDYLLSHFFLSDYSQTFIYNGKVSSLPYLLQQYQNDLTGLFNAIQITLSTYLGRYFNNVVVQADQYPNPTNSGSLGINLFVSYVDNEGQTLTFTKVINTINSKIQNIININNNG